MAMKIATRINSIEGGSKLRGRLRGRLPGGFEAGLQSLEAMQIAEKTPMFRRMKQGSRQACTQRNMFFQHDVARFNADLETSLEAGLRADLEAGLATSILNELGASNEIREVNRLRACSGSVKAW